MSVPGDKSCKYYSRLRVEAGGPTSTQNLCFQEENTVAVQLLNDNQYGCNALCFQCSTTFDWAYHWWFRDGYRLGKASIKKKNFFSDMY